MREPVAQCTECLVPDQDVAGSNPVGLAVLRRADARSKQRRLRDLKPGRRSPGAQRSEHPGPSSSGSNPVGLVPFSNEVDSTDSSGFVINPDRRSNLILFDDGTILRRGGSVPWFATSNSRSKHLVWFCWHVGTLTKEMYRPRPVPPHVCDFRLEEVSLHEFEAISFLLSADFILTTSGPKYINPSQGPFSCQPTLSRVLFDFLYNPILYF